MSDGESAPSIARRLILLCTLATCACARPQPARPAPPVAEPPRTPSVAIAAPQPAPECAADVDCAQPAASTRTIALCEQGRCEHYDESVALYWAASIVPMLAELEPYRALSLASAPWFQTNAPIQLYVRGDWLDPEPLPKPCVALEFTADDAALVAHLDAQGRPSTPRRCKRQLILDAGVTLIDDACNPRGTGDEQVIGQALILSAVDSNGLVYDGLHVRATPRCEWFTVQHAACPERVCRACRLGLDFFGQSGMQHFVTSAPNREYRHEAAKPSCGPCLPDAHEVFLPRVATILRDRVFLYTLYHQLALHFFRAKTDCNEYVQRAGRCED